MVFSTGPLVELGHIAKPHGYEGWVRIELDDDIEINATEPLFLMFNQKPVPFFIDQKKGTNPVYLKLRLVDNLESAQALNGHSIYIEYDGVDEDEDEGIIGYQVVDHHMGVIGPVEDVIENPGQDLIQTTYQSKPCLIPLVDDFIERVDSATQTIYMRLPEGLFNLAD